jgi:hypothetical protein
VCDNGPNKIYTELEVTEGRESAKQAEADKAAPDADLEALLNKFKHTKKDGGISESSK